jgi:signal transduction histidine kinase
MKPQFPGIVALERIEWTVDGRLALIALAGFPRAAEPQPWAGLIGQPITRLFRMGEGDLPLLDAFARRLAFSDQSACLDDPAGGAWRLAAIPIFDAAADFAGFRGQALPETGASHEANRPAIASSPRPDAVVHVPASGAELGTDVGEALREPLGVIVEQADAIRERRDGPLRRGYADYAADIASAGRHLMSLVEDLVEVQAIEHADFSTARDVVELCELARQAVGLVASRAARKEIAIDILCDEGNVQACGEARRILQILVNLLGNAVRHSPGGGRIEVAIALGDGEARIEVADQGPGIAAEDQARIFDKFERIDRSDPNGSGLGLYISRRLARAMGGRLEVESVPGEGARFRLALPRP